MPEPGWLVDAFMYESPEDTGALFLAQRGRETRVRYADAWRRESTPWHGRWEVSLENSHVFPSSAKQKWAHTVYLDFFGEDETLKPMHITPPTCSRVSALRTCIPASCL